MAKITGFLQKVFGQDATNIGQVGSAALGTKLITNDPDTIQALAAFENGIDDVALTSKRIIPQEEFMALHYLHTLQNAYAQQEGVQEYNADVTYFTNSIVKKSGTYELYGSLVDTNVGNALTDGTKWVLLTDLSSGVSFASNAEAQAFTVSNKVISPLTLSNAFKGSNQSLASPSGYQKFAGGLIIQYGYVVTSGTTTAVTFPISFPTACDSTYCSTRASGTVAYTPAVSNGTTSGLNVYLSTNGIAIGWIAIGH